MRVFLAAFDYLNDLANKGDSVYCSALKGMVSFTKAEAKKFKSLSANPVKSKMAAMIKQIIEKTTLVKENVPSYDANEKKRGITYSILKTAVTLDEETYGVRTVIRKLENGQYQYDLQVKDSMDSIMDSTKENGLWAARLSKSDVPQSAFNQGFHPGELNTTAAMDDVSSSMVLKWKKIKKWHAWKN